MINVNQISSMFYIKPFPDGTGVKDKIAYIEKVYQGALDFIYENEKDKENIHNYCGYAFVLFSNLMVRYVSIDEYAEYIEQNNLINNINSYVQDSRYQGPKL